ncbi:hypothetical protein AciM339_0798 [Aciduliprofundum sp. MAR08-339]|uniref:hypothetical protein n=1 Tax=Aciduliprofundum sp. (strain MAR08-339) TaxID=673860 RepID=UPI0002A4B93B|nr:hypothetical protein AciM339_0798 [Aciduliprofundum sp. MAR08-339]
MFVPDRIEELIEEGYLLSTGPRWKNGVARFYFTTPYGTESERVELRMKKSEFENLKNYVVKRLRDINGKAYYSKQSTLAYGEMKYPLLASTIDGSYAKEWEIMERKHLWLSQVIEGLGFQAFFLVMHNARIDHRKMSKLMEDPEKFVEFGTRYLASLTEASEKVHKIQELEDKVQALKKEIEKKDEKIKHLKAVNYELSTQLNGVLSMLNPSQMRRFSEWINLRSATGLVYATVSPEDMDPGEVSTPINITVIEHDSFMEDIKEFAKLKYALNELDEIPPKEKEQPQVIRVNATDPGKINELSSKIQNIEERLNTTESRVEKVEKDMGSMENFIGNTVKNLVDFNEKSTKAIVKVSNKIDSLEKDLSPQILINRLEERGYRIYPKYMESMRREIEDEMTEMKSTLKEEMKREMDEKIKDIKNISEKFFDYFLPSLGEILSKSDDTMIKSIGEILAYANQINQENIPNGHLPEQNHKDEKNYPSSQSSQT